jgi:hypothetical protein
MLQDPALLLDALRPHESLKDGIIADPRDSQAWLTHPMSIEGAIRVPWTVIHC